MRDFEIRVQGFRVQGSGFMVQDVCFRVRGLEPVGIGEGRKHGGYDLARRTGARTFPFRV
jgi:hypothetical protein